jgi:hypothetical protein
VEERGLEPPHALGVEPQRRRREVEPVPLLRRDLALLERLGEELLVLLLEVAG